MKLNTIYNIDCLKGLESIPTESIDLIFTDLPYGITNNSWDVQIPLEDYILFQEKILTKEQYLLYAYKNNIDYFTANNYFEHNKKHGLWYHFNRIIKEHGTIALWADDKFAIELINSNRQYYRYEWIIEKTKGTGHLNAKRMPLKCHESVLIFYKHLPQYNPQKTTGHSPVHNYTKHKSDGSNYGKTKVGITGGGSTERYPRDVIKFKWDTQISKIHPTQKPIEACKYFIKTYTSENNIVLDATCGSGAILKAAKDLKRNYIGFELDVQIYEECIKNLKY